MDFWFYINIILFGIALSMDACAVSMTNGFAEPNMKISKHIYIVLMFALFQAIMPLIGYGLSQIIYNYVEKFIPIIALVLLLIIGIKMLIEGIRNKEEDNKKELTFFVILIQAIATSIDALSVGVSFSSKTLLEVIISIIVIGVITFILCFISVFIGKKIGNKLGHIAKIIGGIILIFIGIEIFITGFFF